MKRVSIIRVKGKGVQLKINMAVSNGDAVLTKDEIEGILPELEDQITRMILSKTIPFLRVGIRDIEVR